jgi:hypothetical protein
MTPNQRATMLKLLSMNNTACKLNNTNLTAQKLALRMVVKFICPQKRAEKSSKFLCPTFQRTPQYKRVFDALFVTRFKILRVKIQRS